MSEQNSNVVTWATVLQCCNTAVDKTEGGSTNLWIFGPKSDEYENSITSVLLPTLTQKILDENQLGSNSFDLGITVKIAPAAFQNSKLTNIVLGTNVVSIGESAFKSCTELETVDISTQIRSEDLGVKDSLIIEYGAFQDCSSLERITLPFIGDSYNAKNPFFGYIFGAHNPEEQVLYLPKNLSTVKITGTTVLNRETSETTTEGNVEQNTEEKRYAALNLYKKSFYGCRDLQYVYLPNITWPKSTNSITRYFEIPEDCFNSCVSLSYLGTDSDLKYNTLDLYSLATTPTNPINSPKAAALKLIGERAFYGCYNIYSVLLPELSVDLTRKGFPRIGLHAFTDCFNLTGIYGPGLVGLQQAYLGSTLNGDIFTYAAELGLQPNVPELPITGTADLSDLKREELKKDSAFTIPTYENNKNSRFGIYEANYYMPINWHISSTTTVDEEPTPSWDYDAAIFAPVNSASESLSIEVVNTARYTQIKDFAFSNLSITEVTIGDDITEIGDYAFSNCPQLTTVNLPASLTKLGAYAFNNCPNLKKVTFAGTFDKWCEIYFGAFPQLFINATEVIFNFDANDDTNWQRLTGHLQDNEYSADSFEAYTQHVPAYAFYNFKNIYCEVTFLPTVGSKNLITIEDYAFTNCKKLKLILGTITTNEGTEVKSDIAAIGYKAFENSVWSFIEHKADSGSELGLTTYTLGSWLMAVDFPPSNSGLLDILATKNYTVVCNIDTSIKYIKEDVFKNVRQTLNNLQSQLSDHVITIKIKYAGTLKFWAAITFANAWSNPMYQDFEGLSSNTLNNEFYSNIGTESDPLFGLCTKVDLQELSSISDFAFAGFELDEVSICGAVLSSNNIFEGAKIKQAITTPANSPLIASDDLQKVTIKLINNSDVFVPINAFAQCSQLATVDIEYSNSYTGLEFGANAFLNCSKISKVNFSGSISDWCQIRFQNAQSNPCFVSNTEFYCAGQQITNQNQIELANITTIRRFTICNLAQLTTIILNSKIELFEEQWLLGCPQVSTLEYASTVENESSDFIVVNNSVCQIVPETRTYKLITVTTGTDFTKYDINISAVATGSISCYSSPVLVLPDNITQIALGAIDPSLKLTELTIPFLGAQLNDATTAFFGYIFGANNVYESAKYIPNTLKTVLVTKSTRFENFAFQNCKSLEHIYTSANLEFVGSNVFTGCNIQDDLFYSCTDYYNSISTENPTALTDTSVVPTMMYRFPKELLMDKDLNYLDSIDLEVSYPIYEYAGQAISKNSPPTKVNLKITGKHSLNIGQYAFKGCKNITSFAASEDFGGALTIDKHAFYSCTNLASVELVENIALLGTEAFYGCKSLQELTIPNSVVGVETDEGTFDFNIIKPSTVGANVFKGCDNLKHVTMPTALSPYISKDKLETVSLTAGTYVRTAAFNNCKMLKKVELAESIKVINEQAFKGCILLSHCDLSNITMIESEAFMNCVSLYSIGMITETLLDCLQDFDKATISVTDVFLNCPKLVEICLSDETLLNTVITNIYTAETPAEPPVEPQTADSTIPRKSRYNKLFNTAALEDLFVAGQESQIANQGQLVVFKKSDVLAVVDLADGSAFSELVIPEGITKIHDYAFVNCPELKSVQIPTTLQYIGSYAFYSCDKFEKFTVDSTQQLAEYQLETIAPYAFVSSGIKQTTDIFLAKFKKLTVIDDSVFESCKKLTDIFIPHTITLVQASAFKNCPIISKITAATNHAVYGKTATNTLIYQYSDGSTTYYNIILGCSNSVLPADVPITKIAANAFTGCEELHEIRLPETLITIERDAFAGCISLDTILFEGAEPALKQIDSCAFKDCTNLASIDLSTCHELETIGSEAFSGCKALTEVKLPTQLKSIYTLAFAYCNLSTITLYRYEVELENGSTEIVGLTTVGSYIFTGNKPTLHIYCNNELPNSYNTDDKTSTVADSWKNTWNYKSQFDETVYLVTTEIN